MVAFAPSTPLVSSTSVDLSTSFTAAPVCARPTNVSAAPTMVLRNSLRVATEPPVGAKLAAFGGVAKILDKADEYMAYCVNKQYLQMSNPTGEYGVQCTEGSVKLAADAARIRVLGNRFRAEQASNFKKYFDVFEFRKMSVQASHECHHEEGQFCDYPTVASSYCISKSEATGACARYATPETVEEAAMLRYMEIQQNIAANPTGVYNTLCNEGSSKFQAEDIRVASLNAAFRQGQKPMGQLLQEKYNQRQWGYSNCNGCNYEEGLVSKFPAIGAAFRSKAYGY